MPVCAACGETSPPGFRFCGSCGAAVLPGDDDDGAREQRKTVTLLFCDVTGSTALGERLDPETLRRVMSRYFDEIEAVIARHGGTVEKFVGDAVMAVFGVPRVREDDAVRAVRAAAQIRDRLPAVAAELGVELTWRTGVNTGEVVVGHGQTLATGDGINVAARLEQAAAPGEILIGADTQRLVRAVVETEPIEPLALKGKSEPVEAYRLLRVTAGLHEPTDVQSVFVGRQRELQLLHDAFDRAADGACHLFTLLGAAGVGKSRLTARFLDDIADRATVLRGRCLSYGDAITFFPLVDVLEQLGDEGADALRLVAEGGAVAPNELFLVVRRTLERAARERPLVVVLDDLHWAEPMLFDLIDHIADLSRAAPLLLLCIARPELLDVRPGWGGGKLNASTVLLEPLGTADCDELLTAVAEGLAPSVREHVAQASEGNPLFAVEMVALAREGGDVSASPTIAAILAARLDQLGDEERAIIERGAVEGKIFHSGAVREMTPEQLRSSVDTHLSSLVRKDLVRPQAALFADEDGYRFRHLLVRDAAYDALPKRVRADLHAQFADWLEHHAVGLIELAELTGWHLEQAVRYRQELGLDIDPDLVVRAGTRLVEAGRNATARADVAAAEKLFTRGIALLPDDAPARDVALIALADNAVRRGDLDRADALLTEAETRGETARGVATRLSWLAVADPPRVADYVVEHAKPMLDRLSGGDDDAGMAALHLALFSPCWYHADAAGALRELDLAVEHARRAGDASLVSLAMTTGIGPLVFGPAQAEELRRAIARREAAVGGGGPMIELGIRVLRCQLARLQGDLGEATAQGTKARALASELGLTVLRAAGAAGLADIAIYAGDLDEAVRLLRDSDQVLRDIGERGFRSTVVANLAEALYRCGELDEAERRALEAEELSAPEDYVNFVIGRAVRARILADRDDLGVAEELARSSLDYAERTDFPVQRAEARSALAYVLARAGQGAEAATALQAAIELSERKGDRPLTARLRAQLATLAESA